MAMKTMSKTARTTTNAKEDEHDANGKKKKRYTSINPITMNTMPQMIMMKTKLYNIGF